MADIKTNISEGEIEDREEQRRIDDEAEQQDLNQGMDTGTHDPKRSGVDWGPSYRARGKKPRKSK